MINQLNVTVTKTADLKAEYIQIMSDDQMTVNVVVIANRITIADMRSAKPAKRKETSNF